jgi:hypothetical protein
MSDFLVSPYNEYPLLGIAFPTSIQKKPLLQIAGTVFLVDSFYLDHFAGAASSAGAASVAGAASAAAAVSTAIASGATDSTTAGASGATSSCLGALEHAANERAAATAKNNTNFFIFFSN